MATQTSTFGFQRPDVGGDLDNWGDMLNRNWTDLDSLLRRGSGSRVNADFLDGFNGTAFARLTGGANADFSRIPRVDGRDIVSFGSNSDGGFLRFENGVQMVINRKEAQVTVNRYVEITSNYPVPFSSTPAVFLNASGPWSEHFGMPLIVAESNNGNRMSLRFVSSDTPPGTTQTWSVSRLVIGQWS